MVDEKHREKKQQHLIGTFRKITIKIPIDLQNKLISVSVHGQRMREIVILGKIPNFNDRSQ